MPDLLFEIGTEEMPALEVPRLAAELKAESERAFSAAHLAYKLVDLHYTPRRLVLLVRDLASVQEDQVKEVKGPPAAVAFNPDGSPTQAAIGFAKTQGVAVEALERVEVENKVYAFARQTVPGRKAVDLLPEILPPLVKRLHPSKSMRWDNSGITFLRPIRWLVCLYGKEVIPVTLGTLRASRVTRGHRFLKQEEVTLESAAVYEAALEEALVTVDPQTREDAVIGSLKEAARKLEGEYLIDGELLGRIVNGGEHPTPVLGHVAPEFINLPVEVVQATLREEGKFVPFILSDGTSPYFMGFRDGLRDEKGIVRAGFERVVRARLRDSQFFFDKDRHCPLAERVRELRKVIYDIRLGSLWDKVERIRALAGEIAIRTGRGTPADVDRAAFLCKADLVTELVKAFPELQGVAGKIYARLDGEPDTVAVAIHEHYLPSFSGDELPQSDVGIVISLADKLDTVVGALLAGEEPTGSRDPYGIKRQANGLIHLATAKGIDLDFLDLIHVSQEIYTTIEQKVEMSNVVKFLTERARQFLRHYCNIPADVIAAVFAAEAGNFYRLLRRAQVLTTWRKRETFQSLVIAFSRVRNITKSVETDQFDPKLFTQEAERVLWREYLKVEGQLTRFFKTGDYAAAIERLVTLKEPIDRYFDDVLVMAKEEDLKRNRLGFLSALAGLFLRIGDFSVIVTDNAPS